MARAALIFALLALLVPLSARGDDAEFPPPPALHYAPLDAAASAIAKRDVTVRCPTDAEADADGVLQSGAWGYVWFRWGEPAVDYAIVKPYICADALHLSQADEWDAALAVLVIVHESWHLRDIYKNESEAVTECRAIKSFERGVQLLGGSAQLARNLLGEALAIHRYWLPAIYQLKGCRLPVPEARP